MRRAQTRRLSFSKLNRIRVERLYSLFPTKKQSFLELLPLLFQVNSDLLPGYHGPDTPAGIVDYQPPDQSIAAARRLNSAFQYQRHTLHHYSIRGVYLINRQDFFHYHPKAQFDLWVVYAAPLDEHARQLLEKKLASICQWAKESFDISCQPSLFEQQDLISGKLSDMDRDRFYHSGLVLAGCYPDWWTLAPSKDEPVLPLQRKSNHATLDFGNLSPPTALTVALLTAESIHNTMKRGLETCLDLIYYQTAIQHFSSFKWISEQIKQRLITGTTKPRQLDTDNLKLHFIQQQCQDEKAILLAQQSLYVLCNERLSKPIAHVALPWRREFIKDCIYQWDWPDKNTRLKQLDQRYQSRYRDTYAEYQSVSNYIEHTLSTLKHFAQQHKLNIDTQLFNLEQEYRYLFHSSADQIPCLPAPFLPKQHEQYLYLSREDRNSDWHINDQELPVSSPTLYQHRSLLNVLAWAIQNRLLTHATHLKLADKTFQIHMSQLLDLVHFMLRTELATKRVNSELFSLPALAECDSLLVFANLDHHPVNALSQKGLEISSLQTDPLNYASHYQNLVASMEGLTLSTAGQWFYFIHKDNSAIPESLVTLLGWEKLKPSAADILCWSPPENHATKIKKRIRTLFKEVIAHYHKNHEHGIFILQLGGQFFKLQWQQGTSNITAFPRHATLLDCLSSNKYEFAATQLDSEIDKHTLFSTLLSYQKENTFSLFLLNKAKTTVLYILDDVGNLFEQTFENIVESTLIAHYYEFLNTLDYIHNETRISAYQLHQTTHHQWQVSALELGKEALKRNYLPVIVELDNLKKESPCTIHCGKSLFSGLRNDAALFNQVKQFVLHLRNRLVDYPLYITRLIIKNKSRLTAKDYIIHKRLLETQLNK